MFVVLAIFNLLLSAVAVPTFNDLGGRTSINSLVSHSSYVQAFAKQQNNFASYGLTLDDPAYPSNLTVVPNTHGPGVPFYVHKNRLWVYRNESAIWPVNLVNATRTPSFPLQLVVGTAQFGVGQGTWSWRGILLEYDHGAGWQSFVQCPMPNGRPGIFMYTVPYVPLLSSIARDNQSDLIADPYLTIAKI
ncbi:hypothetical protein AX15_007683 [Amanita polypyramis BW_CC]|nr:hypothetical protein AX15_007683 [Amanita polypyramis BW_CC]